MVSVRPCGKLGFEELMGNDLSVTDFVGDSSPGKGAKRNDIASALAPLPGELSAVRLTERSSPAACQVSVCRRTEQLPMNSSLIHSAQAKLKNRLSAPPSGNGEP